MFEEGSPITTEQATKVWENLSRRYAEGASGTAYAFIKGSRPTSIFNTIEYNTLLNNPDVTNVISSLLQM